MCRESLTFQSHAGFVGVSLTSRTGYPHHGPLTCTFMSHGWSHALSRATLTLSPPSIGGRNVRPEVDHQSERVVGAAAAVVEATPARLFKEGLRDG